MPSKIDTYGAENDFGDDIAVIGLDLKFPGDATSPESFFEMLLEGRSALSDIPKERYNIDAFYHPDPERAGAINIRKAHHVKEDIAAFDAPFFSITPVEASSMDPQQRGLLESVYRTLENAGIPLSKAMGSNTSVYIGCFTREYDGVLARDSEIDLKYVATGTGTTMLANRLSWFYDFHGPSMALDTACSSSLVACHLACNSLKIKESSMAIVGGCNLFYNPDTCVPLTSLGFLSPDSKCYSFDHRANGYSRGEGFGTLILKRLSDAIRDQDTIRAVIRSTVANQDGKSPGGITQPTREAQVAATETAYDQVKLDPAITRYFEAHGTGTPVGDPIEASAIGQVFSKYRSSDDPLYVGAVKSNIGHLEGAAGIAGLMKAIHVLESGIIPPNIWFEKANPKILESWNLKFPTTATPWPSEGVRRASINSFGYGGSNAHVVMDDTFHYLAARGLVGKHRTVEKPALESAKDLTNSRPTNGELCEKRILNGNGIHNTTNGAISSPSPTSEARIFAISAFDEDGIERLTKAYCEHLTKKKDSMHDESNYLKDLCFTLASKRTAFPWRTATVAKSLPELIEHLDKKLIPIKAGVAPRLAFVFSGQGAQWFAMGRELLTYSVFRGSLQAASDYLHELGCHWSLLDELQKDETSSSINDPEYSQAMCTALQIALVDLLASANVYPASVVGHSAGEIAAAYASGAISRSTAWRLSYHRGVLSSALARSAKQVKGGMLSVSLNAADAQNYVERLSLGLGESLTIACINSPKNVTISGSSSLLEELQGELDSAGVFNRRLVVDNAYHSPYMEPIAAEYRRLIGRIKPGATTSSDTPKYYSSSMGTHIELAELQSAEYWVRTLLSPVRFSSALSHLLTDASPRAKKLGARQQSTHITELVEIGPHSALQGPIREIVDQIPDTEPNSYVTLLKRRIPATTTFLEAVGWLYCRGHPINVSDLGGSASDPAPQLLINLPSYPFNHSKTYWSESRLSKGYRFRQAHRHELLGAPVPDWDKSNAIWRNWIRVGENPWIKDHRITGTTLYPAAGMLVMAIEASRQLAAPEKKVKAFRFKEVSLHMALGIPLNADGVETHFHMRPHVESTALSSSTWSEFELRSYTPRGWIEHCRGLIQTEYETSYTPVDDGLEDRQFVEGCLTAVNQAEESCQSDVSIKQLYEILQTVGFDFGPTFQNLSDVRIGSGRHSIATVTAPDLKSKMALGYLQPHLIHPTTLDGALQSVVVAMTRGGKDVGEVMVPSFFKEIWIAADEESNHTIHRVQANSQFLGLRQAEANLISVDPVTKKPLIVIEGFVTTAVGGQNAARDNKAGRHVCYNIDWKPDPSFVTQEIATRVFTAPQHLLDFDPSELNQNMESLCFFYMKRYMKTCTPAMVESMKPHHQKYVAWMNYQFERFDRGENIHAIKDWNKLANDDDYFQSLERWMDGASPEATITVAVGQAMPEILAGEVDPLQILFQEKRAENVYRAARSAEISYERLAAYVDALAHKNPGMKILEIGAGTGGITHPMLETLTYHKREDATGIRFSSYDFTDISPSFFEKAKETFHYAVDRMTFKVLNVENDPVQQGFEPEQYDIVVASNVFHATKSIDTTLKNVRKLMKKGGKLLLYEITNNTTMQTGFGFGLLPGWWLSEEPYRKWSPLLSVPDWSKHMERTGFTGVDISFADYPGVHNHMSTLMVSTASGGESKVRATPEVVILANTESSLQQQVAQGILKSLLELGVKQCAIVPIQDLQDETLKDKSCIFLADIESPFLLDLSSKNFDNLKKLITTTNSLFWLTQGGGKFCDNPNAELVTGLSRTVRSENPTIKFVTVSVDQKANLNHIVNTAISTFDAIFLKANKDVVDTQFADIDGVIQVPRIVEADYMNQAISAKTTLPRPHPAPFGVDPSRALKLVVGSPGLLNTLHFVDDPAFEEPLKPHEVEYKVMASGLNFLDVMVSLGQVVGSQIGVEGAGVVTRAGSDAPFKPGDRVCGITRGSVKSFSRTIATNLVRMPDDLSFVSAATLPVVFATAYCCLYEIADIQQGETVLIHAAAGGVGQACIQLAKLRGAEIYATVGSIEKRTLLEQEYGIPRDHIFSSRDLTFQQGIKRMTNKRGVDVIVNALSGPALRASWECIAPFGRFVEIGKVDIYSSARLNMEMFKNNVRFEFIDVGYLSENHEQRFQGILTSVMQLVAAGKISELRPITVYPLSRLEEAFRYMQSGAHSGKIVVEMQSEDTVMMLPSQKPSYHFDANASYVISGGTGGLGRSMARWMVRRGARNLILLSRSGDSSDKAKELLVEMKAAGAHVVAISCDVTDQDALSHALRQSLTSMPPIKGCIQGSMVLKDAIWANMTLDEYNTAVKPKVHASWNLHDLLPKNLDFFILLSSGSGIVGKGGQGNYCVGNTYQDALARYRIRNGLKASVVDLGIILSVGYAAERVDVMGHLRAQGYSALREEEYHAMLDELCNPNNTVAPILRSQISLGFELPETLRSKGIEFPGWMHDPLFRHLHQIRTVGGVVEDSKDSVNYAMLLAGAGTREAAEELITKAIVQKLSKALGLDVSVIDPSQPMHVYGVDSLVAVEMRTWLLKEMGAEVAVFDMVGESTIRSLGVFVAARSNLVQLGPVEE